MYVLLLYSRHISFYCWLQTYSGVRGCTTGQGCPRGGGVDGRAPPSLGFGSITKFVQDILDLKIFEIFTDAELGSLLIISFFRVRSFAWKVQQFLGFLISCYFDTFDSCVWKKTIRMINNNYILLIRSLSNIRIIISCPLWLFLSKFKKYYFRLRIAP